MFDSPDRAPIAQAPLSVILLANGPTSAVAEAVSAWQAFLATLDRPFETIVLRAGGHGSSDDANAVLGAVRGIGYEPASGFGPALSAAIRAAQHPLVALATADGQFDPADLQRLLKDIDNVDLAVGCRTVAPPPAWRAALGRVGAFVGRVALGLPLERTPCVAGATPWRRRWAAHWALGVHLRDPESPFRLSRRDALVRIVLQSHGPFALVEQLAKANHLEFIMTEEPIAWTPPVGATMEPAEFARDLRAVFREPDFGTPELHTAAGANPGAVPTNPASPSS